MASNRLTVIVTGASGNLGRAVAAAFAARAANLVLVARSAATLAAAHGAEDAQRAFAAANLLDPDAVEGVVQIALGRFGRIDALANLAGGFRMGPPTYETPAGDWASMYDTNVRTVLNAVHAVVPRMLAAGGGKIVNVGAHAALKGVARMAPYCAAKSAVVRITEAMAAELRERNVNVNCVLPTIIDTPENRAAMPDADPRRWVAPDDLARVIVFLASDDARAIHGAAIPVAGLS